MTVNFFCCVCEDGDDEGTWDKLSVSRSDDADGFPLRLTNKDDRDDIMQSVTSVMVKTASAMVSECKSKKGE